ncbi:signal peptidase II [Candidatus Falkowbacteria bacterium]|nr:signal peptidase II [Candidatus Falkowbacteria bacterium]
MNAFKNYYLIIFGAAIIAIDQLIKYLLSALPLGTEFFIVKNDFFTCEIALLNNPYLAFGIKAPAFIITAILTAIIIVLIIFLKKSWQSGNLVSATGLSLIAGGAAANVIDRISRGAVLDYLTLSFRGFEWATFNFADAIITISLFVVILNELKRRNNLSTHLNKDISSQ